MRVAIATSDGRVSPVFDVARQLLVVDLQGHSQADQRLCTIDASGFYHRVEQICGLSVDVLICGAISQPLEAMLIARGVQVIARICGDTQEVLRGFISNRLDAEAFRMPGCRIQAHPTANHGQGGWGRRQGGGSGRRRKRRQQGRMQ